MPTLTFEIVRDLHAHVCQVYGLTLVDAASKEALKAFETWLVSLGVPDVDKYMGQYATTVATTIYLPYTPGVDDPAWPLVWQCATIAHEAHHGVQYKTRGTAFQVAYAINTEDRAYFEAECYRASGEIQHYLTGQPLPPDHLGCLHAYLCTPADIAYAKKIQEDGNVTLAAGGVYTETSKTVLAFLASRGVEKFTA